MKKNSFTKGLTLIELLISMGIIVLLLAAGIPAYSNFKNSNDLDQAAEDVKSAILETQNLAMAPDESKSSTVKISGSEYAANTYLISFGNGNWWRSSGSGWPTYSYSCNGAQPNNYGIYLASEVLYPQPDANYLVKSFILPSGITFDNCKMIQYSIPQAGKIVYPGTSNAVITIKSSKTGKSKTVTVNYQTGQVTIQSNP